VSFAQEGIPVQDTVPRDSEQKPVSRLLRDPRYERCVDLLYALGKERMPGLVKARPMAYAGQVQEKPFNLGEYALALLHCHSGEPSESG
jgi:hypothetical protein